MPSVVQKRPLGEWQVFRDCQHHRIGLVCSQLVELAYGSSAHAGIHTGENVQNQIFALPSFNV